MKKQQITIIDKYSGEILEYEYATIEEAEQVYLQVSSMYKALEHAKGKLTEFMGRQVDVGDKHDFEDGYKGQWITGSRKKYRLEVVRKWLDEDQLALVTDINGKKLKELLEELVMQHKGIQGAWKDIEANADETPTKAYFSIKKG